MIKYDDDDDDDKLTHWGMQVFFSLHAKKPLPQWVGWVIYLSSAQNGLESYENTLDMIE